MERDVKVKICGITTETEIGYLNESEADYAGFVFWEKSKRYITLQKAKKLKDKLINHIKTVSYTHLDVYKRQDIDLSNLYQLKDKYPATYLKVEEQLESGWEGVIRLMAVSYTHLERQ